MYVGDKKQINDDFGGFFFNFNFYYKFFNQSKLVKNHEKM